MNRIYRSARNVLIWIGHERRDIGLAFDALRLLGGKEQLVDPTAIGTDPSDPATARLCLEAISCLGAGV